MYAVSLNKQLANLRPATAQVAWRITKRGTVSYRCVLAADVSFSNFARVHTKMYVFANFYDVRK